VHRLFALFALIALAFAGVPAAASPMPATQTHCAETSPPMHHGQQPGHVKADKPCCVATAAAALPPIAPQGPVVLRARLDAIARIAILSGLHLRIDIPPPRA